MAKWHKAVLAAALGVAVTAAAGLAVAQADIIKTRQEGMKAQGAAMAAIKKVVDENGPAANAVAPAETIAADMQVRIPLGENLSMLAGLLGAWPIAVSTYLASKIFADQVEDFTTIIYRLEGTWENPQAGFEAPSEEVNE